MFSLRTLFILVGMAALFAAAFTFQTHWWAIASVSLTLVVLIAASAGLMLRLVTRPFWLTFAFVGWLYFAIAFADASLTRVPLNLVTTRVAFDLWMDWNPGADDVIDNLFQSIQPGTWSHFKALATGSRVPTIFMLERVVTFYYFLDIVQSLFTLVFAALAGVIASIAVRRARISPAAGTIPSS